MTADKIECEYCGALFLPTDSQRGRVGEGRPKRYCSRSHANLASRARKIEGLDLRALPLNARHTVERLSRRLGMTVPEVLVLAIKSFDQSK